jgi:hypothetical protein
MSKREIQRWLSSTVVTGYTFIDPGFASLNNVIEHLNAINGPSTLPRDTSRSITVNLGIYAVINEHDPS